MHVTEHVIPYNNACCNTTSCDTPTARYNRVYHAQYDNRVRIHAVPYFFAPTHDETLNAALAFP